MVRQKQRSGGSSRQMRRGKRGSPGVPVAGAGSQTCDGSLAERKLVRQGVGPRARVRVRAKLGAHERF